MFNKTRVTVFVPLLFSSILAQGGLAIKADNAQVQEDESVKINVLRNDNIIDKTKIGLNNLSDLPNKDELKASGFLDKRAAIATIGDLAKNDEQIDNYNNSEVDEESNLDDFIQNN